MTPADLPVYLRDSVNEGLLTLDEAVMIATEEADMVIRPRGRPATGAVRTQVRLLPEDIYRARKLGDGNVSA